MRHLCVILFLAVLLLSSKAGAQEIVSITKPTTAQILLDNKVIGSAKLPVGQDYQLLGLVNQQYLLQQGTMRYLVDPHATNYEDLYLLRPLGLNHPSRSTPGDSSYVPDVTIYPTSDTQVASQTIPADPSTTNQDSTPTDRPFRSIVQTQYTTDSYYPYYYLNYYYGAIYYPPISIRHFYPVTGYPAATPYPNVLVKIH